MRNILLYPPPAVRNLLDKTTAYRAARYFYFSRQVTPGWSALKLATKLDHLRRVYRFCKI